MPDEVEIKFLVDDLPALEQKLLTAGFRQVTPSTHEMNVLFDYPDGQLRKRGEILRIRKYGDQWRLTHKSKSVNGRHKSRREIETVVHEGTALEAIFTSLGLAPVFRYEKFRAEWTDGHGHVVLDHTPVGDVAEIEGEPHWIDHTAQRLGIPQERYLTCSYAELFRRWKERTRSAASNMTFAECGTK